MKWRHWKLGTVLSGVLILLCLVWGPESEAPEPIQPVATPDTAPPPVVSPQLPSARPTRAEMFPSTRAMKGTGE